MKRFTSKTTLLALLVTLVLSLSLSVIHAQDPIEVRIGYQRGGLWTVLKAQPNLQERFGDNVTITWTLFPAGPQLLEALNAGAIDIGATGETPPIFAQAAGTPLVYVSYQSGSGAGSAIIVPENSPINTVEDLVGKQIAFNRASSAHLLTIRALEQAGLTYDDVTPVFLAPPDARAAFQGGSIDAWTIWNSFLEAAIQELNAKVVVSGETVSPTKGYTLASRTFVDAHPELVNGITEELQIALDWSVNHLDEYAQIQADDTGLDPAIWRDSFANEVPSILYIDEEAIAYQQEIADIFYALELIPEPLVIADAVWIGGENPEPTATPEVTATPTA
jgi:sulfonate transport system substrate-binding protein